MSQRKRILIALAVLAVLCAGVLGIDFLRQQAGRAAAQRPGSIPVYVDGGLLASLTQDDLKAVPQASFRDAEQGKEQNGWPLRDCLLTGAHLSQPDSQAAVVVTSSSRNKSARLTWAEVADQANMVLLTASGRGTLKLVSRLPQLDIRDEWVQDVDRIEITSP